MLIHSLPDLKDTFENLGEYEDKAVVRALASLLIDSSMDMYEACIAHGIAPALMVITELGQ